MKRTLIIAEAGVNHNGNFINAKKLIKIAKDIGADIIKFQIFKTEELTTKNTPLANYQKKTKFKRQYQMLRKLELSENSLMKLKNYSKKIGIEFCASFFGNNDLILAKKLNLKIIKIPSGEITNFFLLQKIGKMNKKIILSTGMSSLKEIHEAVNLLIKCGTYKKNISLLHCNSEYPTPLKDVNLLALKELKNQFKLRVGYSDHSTNYEVPISAICLGAKIIEKHLTLNKKLSGPDHSSSLNPVEFKEMVTSIRNTEKLLGSEKKIVSASERKNIFKCRQYLITRKKIRKGEVFSFNNITCKRTGIGGISPMKINNIINKVAKKNYKKNEKL